MRKRAAFLIIRARGFGGFTRAAYVIPSTHQIALRANERIVLEDVTLP